MPTRNVLPTWRGMLSPVPPIVEAYFPSTRLARMICPMGFCHQRKLTPNSAHFASMAGHPVETMPFGMTTCRATSDSRGVEGFVSDFAILSRLFLGRSLQGGDLLGVECDLPVESCERGSSGVGDVLDHLAPLSLQDVEVRARFDGLGERQGLGGLRVGLGGDAQTLGGHAVTSKKSPVDRRSP